MDDAALRQLALDMVENRVIASSQIAQQDPDMIPRVFMVLALGRFSKADVKTWGLVYEYLNKAIPAGINGWPVFASARVVHRDDMPALRRYFSELVAARKAFLSPSKACTHSKPRAARLTA